MRFVARIGTSVSAALIGLLILGLPGQDASGGNPGPASPGRKYTALERMKLPRLEAVHKDAARIKGARREVELKIGLNDYWTILHAHAEDSNHTGGTRPEMLEDAKKTGVHCIMLTDHFRPPRDFIDGSWRGLHDGVLFIPGSETNGYLIYPERSMMDKMKLPNSEFVAAVTEGDGLIFLSHVESKLAASMDGLTGMEIYNNHYDAMEDAGLMLGLLNKMTDPDEVAEIEKGLELYPAEIYSALVDYPLVYIKKWDQETQARRLTGVAANDCHHNQVYLVKMVDENTVIVGTNVDKDEDMRTFTSEKRPKILEMTKGRKPGDVLVRLDFDTYSRSYLNCSTHVLAPELTEPAIRAALKGGHAYVSHDWLCDPRGFAYVAQRDGKQTGVMGDEMKFEQGLTLVAEFPNTCEMRMIRNGEVAKSETGHKLEFNPDGPGVFRVEGWFTLDDEQRIWIYSNPIYLR